MFFHTLKGGLEKVYTIPSKKPKNRPLQKWLRRAQERDSQLSESEKNEIGPISRAFMMQFLVRSEFFGSGP